MSNYTVTTNFAAKDSLPSGNPAKLILGAQLTTEFANIATAIATKLDSSGEFVSSLTSNTGLSTNVAATGAVTITNTGVLSIAGTANQITASASTGAVTLSLPQNVVLTATTGDALDVHGSNGNFAAQIFGSASSGNSFGLNIEAGTTSADESLLVLNQAGSAVFLRIFGDGHGSVGPSATSGIQWTAAGNVTIAAPGSGTGLTVGTSTSGIQNAQIGLTNFGVGVTFLANQAEIFTTSATSLNIGSSGTAALNFYTAALNRLTISAAGGLFTSGATGGDQGLGTLNTTGLFINGVAVTAGGGGTTGSFSAGTTGLTGATAACTYTKVGTAVTMFMAVPTTLVSSATGFTLTGLPAAIQPTTAKYATCPGIGLNNSAAANNVSALVSGSTITLGISGAAAAWTASGNKTVGDATHGAVFCWDTT